ncbi:TfoX/Sxy family protein [Aestuariirhabdus litorea]|uniref:Competence protein TfoX n=1 Tax=Aestuariirhabdus litorea TaxID=2528527 RepID=A0A3P3VHM8_9GAMM|nr:TfoX/Sxy family protein [Aestuariirhabdus litorea]RRJ82242.1 competence protein TfoX [Aestuariirhabdus litorea]RWW92410.1 competence protein TfoX [Endozoicomonadaceae bacterium GTF-13]
MSSNLIEMKNLGKTSVQWLNAVGIRDKEKLQEVGSVEAYRKIKTRGFKVSKVLLYALEGALINAHWNKLDPSLKERLVEQAEDNG